MYSIISQSRARIIRWSGGSTQLGDFRLFPTAPVHPIIHSRTGNKILSKKIKHKSCCGKSGLDPQQNLKSLEVLNVQGRRSTMPPLALPMREQIHQRFSDRNFSAVPSAILSISKINTGQVSMYGRTVSLIIYNIIVRDTVNSSD